ncbi:hypothetical protein GBO31_23260 [Aquimarina litoralis]|nr:hypothetical protein [Aquimarina litoralis]
MKKGYIDSTFYNQSNSIPNGKITTNIAQLHPLRNEPLRYSNSLYLLINTKTYSSASDFSWCFKHYDMGTVIGQETGGHAVSFGEVINVELPFSKLNIGISSKHFYRIGASDKNRHGTIPEIKVNSEFALKQALELTNI